MAQRERKNKKSNKSKIVLIFVLGVILVAVAYIQFGEMVFPAKPSADLVTSEKNDRVSKRPKLPLNKTVARAARSKTNKVSRGVGAKTNVKQSDETEIKRTIAWSKVPNEKLKNSVDPFDYPGELTRMEQAREKEQLAKKMEADLAEKRAAVQAERDRIKKTIARLMEKGVELTYIDGDQRMAKIDGNMVIEGDVIEGLRIVEIKANGEVIIDAPNWPADVPDLSNK